MANDQVEQRRHALVLRSGGVGRHPALLGRAVEDREVELLLARVERGEQVEHLVGDLGRPRVRPVDLVDDDDRLAGPTLSALETTNLVCGIGPSAASTSTSAPSTILRMRSTSPPKSAWPGVSTILMRVSCQTIEVHLRQDGDAALALEVVGIQRALGDALVVAKRARLLQQPVDQRGLAVVDVGDDGDVAEVHMRNFAP